MPCAAGDDILSAVADVVDSQVPGAGVRVPVFDGVRGVAILAVIVYHSLEVYGTPADRFVSHFTSAGWLGVDLFFVLSGFLITGILLDTKGEGGFFRNFYARRTLRIFPLFYATVFVMAFALPIIHSLGPMTSGSSSDTFDRLWRNQLWLWTYTHNFLQARGPHNLPGLGHLWSLAVEEQFYLLWPLVVFVTPRRRILAVALGTSLAVIILRGALAAAGVDAWSLRQWTFTRADALLLGGAAAIIIRTPAVWARVRRWVTPVFLTAMGVLVMFVAVRGSMLLDSEFSAEFVYPIAAIGFAALMLRLCDTEPSRLLSAKWLRTIGFYSYAMYVFHWPISRAFPTVWRRTGVEDALTIAGSRIPLGLVNLLAVTLLSLVCAVISWYVWERRWLALKTRFSYRDVKAATG
jgi:peptidoglycan/LPS O-acetylase OafA/YrhL